MRSRSFTARILSWGGDREHLEFAAALDGFPSSTDSELRYSFGSPGIGSCELYFHCLDHGGGVGVWAKFESEERAGSGEQYEQASLFIRCEPAAIDAFVAELRRFGAGSANRAELFGLGP